MNVECWDAAAVVPPATLTDAQAQADYTPPPPLTRGNEPGDVVILVEIETFSG
jgi:hypothetical protein